MKDYLGILNATLAEGDINLRKDVTLPWEDIEPLRDYIAALTAEVERLQQALYQNDPDAIYVLLHDRNQRLTAEVERLQEETDTTILEARHLYEHVRTHREYADFVIRIAKRQLHLEGGA